MGCGPCGANKNNNISTSASRDEGRSVRINLFGGRRFSSENANNSIGAWHRDGGRVGRMALIVGRGRLRAKMKVMLKPAKQIP